MRRSTERILATHVGSLARPHDLLEMMREKEHGRPYDAAAFGRRVREAVADVVARQSAAGLDVVTAGLVGRENVIASADCGFSSRATFAPEVHPTVVWAKFAALAEGAAIATKRLWGAEAEVG
jgi:methionine synthase II (cobalamin-independent)